MKKLTQKDTKAVLKYIEGHVQKILDSPQRNKFYFLTDEDISQIVALAILEEKNVLSQLKIAQRQEEKYRQRFRTNHLNE